MDIIYYLFEKLNFVEYSDNIVYKLGRTITTQLEKEFVNFIGSY